MTLLHPHFTTNDLSMFYRYLKTACVYMEIGSGGSSMAACREPSVETVVWVESDPVWYEIVKTGCEEYSTKMIPIFSGLNVDRQDNWGHPGPGCTDEQRRAYSDALIVAISTHALRPDVVLVDGRFRVACCLKLFSRVDEDCVILFDDFFPRRDFYGAVLEYFEVVEQTVDQNMIVLRKKKHSTPPPPAMIARFELDSR